MRSNGRLRDIRGTVTAATRSVRGRQGGWVLAGFGLRSVMQAVSLVLLARALSDEVFGGFAAVFAIAQLVGPFVRAGGLDLTIRDVVRGGDVEVTLNRTLTVSTLLMLPGMIVAVLVAMVVLPGSPVGAAVAIAGGAFVSGVSRDVLGGVFLATDRAHLQAVLDVIRGVAFLAASVYALNITATLDDWAWIFLAQNVVASALMWLMLLGRVSLPGPNWDGFSLRRVADGQLFAVGRAAETAYFSIDQAILPYFVSLSVVGSYAIGARVTGLGLAIVGAFTDAMRPVFYRSGRNGLNDRGHQRFRRYALLVTVSLTATMGVAAFLLAPWLSRLLGPGYDEATMAIRLLAPVFAIRGLLVPALAVLSGADMQRRRTVLQLWTLGLNVGLNLLLVPAIGWEGAAIATVVSEGLLLAMVMLTIRLARLQSN